jgi:uncharacterized membrane protein (UPF0127 family)
MGGAAIIRYMKKLLVVFILLTALAGGYLYISSRPKATSPMPTVTATIGSGTYTLFAPRNEAELERGLAAYDSITDSQGMIFRGLPEGIQTIWMKDMKFDIDVLWVNSDNQIIYIVQGMSRTSYPQQFHNPVGSPSAYVIELPAEATLTHSITIGQTVSIQD